MQAQADNRPRRVRVRRGIYRSYNGLYEFCFQGSDGRTHWKGGFARVKEAEAARAQVVVKRSRGERIAATRKTFAEVAEEWLESKGRIRAKTRIGYESALRNHLLPRLARRKIHEIRADDVARLVAELQSEGLREWTIRGALTPLSGILGYAARRGLRQDNPVAQLDRDERPRASRREQRILDDGEIRALLAIAPPKYKLLLTTAIFTGLRLGELLGLRWSDINFSRGFVRVRRQLTQLGECTEPKTSQAKRDVVLDDVLARMLAKHWRDSPFKADSDFVFSTDAGTAMNHRNVERRGLDRAAVLAGLDRDGKPKLRFHDLRHTFASMLIADGADVVYVSRQLGHAKPDITLRLYAHLFDEVRQAERHRRILSQRHGKNLERSDGNERGRRGDDEEPEVAISGENASGRFPLN